MSDELAQRGARADAARPGAARALGHPHLHLRSATSTNDRARALAAAGAPHGTIVTADEQTAGRGRQGRTWSAPAGQSLLLSVVVRDPPELLPLAAGVAVARAIDQTILPGSPPRTSGQDASPRAAIKWPNDVLLAPGEGDPARLKVAGILAEGRPQEGWAVVGIGVNVAVRLDELPAELRGIAATLGREPEAVHEIREAILEQLFAALSSTTAELLEAWRERDALLGRTVTWAGGSGVAAGVDGSGRLIVTLPGGGQTALDAGEVHLGGTQ